jgi:hypothetical protein
LFFAPRPSNAQIYRLSVAKRVVAHGEAEKRANEREEREKTKRRKGRRKARCGASARA